MFYIRLFGISEKFVIYRHFREWFVSLLGVLFANICRKVSNLSVKKVIGFCGLKRFFQRRKYILKSGSQYKTRLIINFHPQIIVTMKTTLISEKTPFYQNKRLQVMWLIEAVNWNRNDVIHWIVCQERIDCNTIQKPVSQCIHKMLPSRIFRYDKIIGEHTDRKKYFVPFTQWKRYSNKV